MGLNWPQGNILEDATAVQILSEAKRVSDDISTKQAAAEETQVRLKARVAACKGLPGPAAHLLALQRAINAIPV